MKVLFYVQNLLGIGHARRSAVIARSLCAEGHQVMVALGGRPISTVDYGDANVVHLPSVRTADSSFKVLIDENGVEIDDAFRDARKNQLLALFEDFAPDAILIESYPFGRRQFRFELLPLLDAATARANPPVVACSVRDILVVKKKAERLQEMADRTNQYFDAVLCHSDPELVKLDATFPHADQIQDKIHYTGYVTQPNEASQDGQTDGAGELVISIGGGAVGQPLLEAVWQAKAIVKSGPKKWRVLLGPDLPEDVRAELLLNVPEGIWVEEARPDFPALLHRADYSLSLGGYNTTMDVLQALSDGALKQALIAPFTYLEETEQLVRAELLEQKGFIHLVRYDELSGQILAEKLEAMFKAPEAVRADFQNNGGIMTAKLLAQLVEKKQKKAA